MYRFVTLLSNDKKELVVNSDGKETKLVTTEDFPNETWHELLINKKTFNELLSLHSLYSDVQFQVKHNNQEDDFEARTVKYYISDFMEDLIANYSDYEIALILKDVEIYVS